jgi:hypothetical protein
MCQWSAVGARPYLSSLDRKSLKDHNCGDPPIDRSSITGLQEGQNHESSAALLLDNSAQAWAHSGRWVKM